jgi:hypothetical protein
MKILAKDIQTKEMVKFILNSLKPMNEYINTLDESSFEYEHLCEKVEEHYLEVDEALIGNELYNQKNIINADIRRMIYWNYIKGEITWKEFVSEIKEYSNKSLLINLD